MEAKKKLRYARMEPVHKAKMYQPLLDKTLMDIQTRKSLPPKGGGWLPRYDVASASHLVALRKNLPSYSISVDFELCCPENDDATFHRMLAIQEVLLHMRRLLKKWSCLSNEYLYYKGIVKEGYPYFLLTPAEAFAFLDSGLYERIDVFLTDNNQAYYEGEGGPGSVTGWVCLNRCEDGGAF